MIYEISGSEKENFSGRVTFTGIAVLFPVLCMAASENDVQTYTDTDFAMDTVVSETLYTTGDDINSKLTAVLTDVETNLLSWTNEKSQIYKVNADSGKDTEISDELSGYLKRLLKIAEDSDEASDPTIREADPPVGYWRGKPENSGRSRN